VAAPTTYAELQTEIAGFLSRSDLTSKIPNFIAYAEAKLNRKLRLREMEQTATASYTSASRFVALPAGFLELMNLRIKKASDADTKYERLKPVAPSRIHEFYRDSAGCPSRYCLRDQFELNREADQEYTLHMYYLKKWDIASDSSNWLLTDYPDAYVYGALVEAEMYVRNDKRVPAWKSMFREVMAELDDLDERSRDDTEMGTDLYLLNSNRYGYDINEG